MTNIFADSDFDQASFTDIVLLDEIVSSKYFTDCTFTNCDFTGCKFESCMFNGCKFDHCNLSLLKVPDCKIYTTLFDTCKMVGINWNIATLIASSTKKKQLFTNVFNESMLDYSLFVGLNLTGIKIIRCTAKDVFFENTNLLEGNFEGTDFSGATFSSCNLTSSDFSSAKNYSINPLHNNLSKAKFAMPEAMSLVYSLGVEIVG